MPLVKEYQCLVSNFQGNAERFIANVMKSITTVK